MSTADIVYMAVTATTIIAVVCVSIPDYVPTQSVLKTSSEVRVPRSWLPWLATAKVAGAVGLAVGLAGFFMSSQSWATASSVIAVAAGAGLVLFFLGALAFHVRARVFYNIYFPAVFLALSVASLALVMFALGQ